MKPAQVNCANPDLWVLALPALVAVLVIVVRMMRHATH